MELFFFNFEYLQNFIFWIDFFFYYRYLQFKLFNDLILFCKLIVHFDGLLFQIFYIFIHIAFLWGISNWFISEFFPFTTFFQILRPLHNK